ncbi:hypothetical protein FACS1894206_07880 [Deltaproteobacteria bacterium]|nr:hypothetical protein FACS1894206_07880 [Deltaproteobacteria bacterium]
MDIVAVLAIIIFIFFLVCYTFNKAKVGLPPEVAEKIHCAKCGSKHYRFLWDKHIVADNKHLEAQPSGYSHRTSSYNGGSTGISVGLSRKLPVFLHGSTHRGTSESYSESYKYKEISIKTFKISCKCEQCGAVWKETVSEDKYPEIKKIPTMK